MRATSALSETDIVAGALHGETVAGNSSETVHYPPSRFTVWPLVIK